MNLVISSHEVKIQLDPPERLWAFHLSERMIVPLNSIQAVRLERPQIKWWKELRAPGTHLPGVFKAGTYYTKKGREFWYVQSDLPCLCLEISDGYYKRIVLSSEKVEGWRSHIQQKLALPAAK